MRRTQMQCVVLAVFLRQLIGGAVESFYFLRLHRVVKERILDVLVENKIAQNHAGGV